MQKPLISILMPFFNAGDAFGAALRSIRDQTYENWELLLCDDGSTDGSLALAQSFQDDRIVLWSDGKNKGLAARLNDCIDRARGQLIARMDADDISYPERFQKQVEYLAAHPEVDLVGCQMLIFAEDGSPIGRRRLPVDHAQIVARPHLGFGLAHPTWMARGGWFRKFRYDVAALRFEDIELLYRSYRTSRFANLPEILYGYREMAGGFRKRSKTRLGRLRYLKTRSNKTMFYRAAVAEGAKIACDALLVGTSTRYSMLRAREERLSQSEIAEWRDVADATAARTVEPARLMMITTIPETLGFFLNQIDLLAKSGFQVHTVSAPGPIAPGIDNAANAIAHRVAMERRPNPVRDLVSAFRLYRLMRRVRPDIVHAHTPKAGLVGMLAARAAGIPVRAYTIHGLPLMTRRGVWRSILASAERFSCALATRVYCVSRSLEDAVGEMNLCPPDKLATVGDGSCAGIDIREFAPSAEVSERARVLRSCYGIPEDAFLLSFIGRIARDKGIAILAEAWRQIAAEFPNAHLLISGLEDASDPVDECVLAELRAHARVRFTGEWVMDRPALYAATDIVVLPTFREGLSQVALESGAMGVPIVSTRIPGLINSVRDGVTGLLVRPFEAAPFAAAVRRLMEDSLLRASLATAARDYIASHFSEQRVNQLWISEYRNLISRSVSGVVNRLAHIETPR